MIVVATGHRPDKLGGTGEAALIALTDVADEWMKETPGIERVVSGMAQGWDTAVALAALNNGIPLIAAVPFKGQEKTWPAEAWALYQMILDRAAKVVVVSRGDYASWKMQRRNVWMVDQLRRGTDDTLLAMHDGTFGGTYNCLKYARSRPYELRIVNLYKRWLARRPS